MRLKSATCSVLPAALGLCGILLVATHSLASPHQSGYDRAGWTEGEYNPWPFIVLGAGLVWGLSIDVPEEPPSVAECGTPELAGGTELPTPVRVELERAFTERTRGTHTCPRRLYGRVSQAGPDSLLVATQEDTVQVPCGALKRIQSLPALSARSRAQRHRRIAMGLALGVSSLIVASTWEPAVFVGPGPSTERESLDYFYWLAGLDLAMVLWACCETEEERAFSDFLESRSDGRGMAESATSCLPTSCERRPRAWLAISPVLADPPGYEVAFGIRF